MTSESYVWIWLPGCQRGRRQDHRLRRQVVPDRRRAPPQCDQQDQEYCPDCNVEEMDFPTSDLAKAGAPTFTAALNANPPGTLDVVMAPYDPAAGPDAEFITGEALAVNGGAFMEPGAARLASRR